MAFAVSQLHECGMTHNNIASKYFKVRLGFCSRSLCPATDKLRSLDFPDHGVHCAALEGEASELKEGGSWIIIQK
jgi:hypothetical protein